MIPTRNRELSGDSITEILLQDPHRKYVPDSKPRRKTHFFVLGNPFHAGHVQENQ